MVLPSSKFQYSVEAPVPTISLSASICFCSLLMLVALSCERHEFSFAIIIYNCKLIYDFLRLFNKNVVYSTFNYTIRNITILNSQRQLFNFARFVFCAPKYRIYIIACFLNLNKLPPQRLISLIHEQSIIQSLNSGIFTSVGFSEFISQAL